MTNPTGNRTVVVLGSHPISGYSMRQYSTHLHLAYKECGVNSVLMRPTPTKLSHMVPSSFRKVVVYWDNLIRFPFSLRRRLSSLEEQGRFTLHLADHSDGPWLLYPWIARHSTVVTCHDLIAIKAARGEYPEHKTRLTGRIYQRLIASGLAKASVIRPVSMTTFVDCQKIFATKRLHLLPNPVRALPTGNNAIAVDGKGSEERRPYALVVSSPGWRKRRELAIQIWDTLRNTGGGHNLDLIIVGRPLTIVEKEKTINIDKSQLQVVPDISDAELGLLYRNADFLIQASKYEGFCLPIIEANSLGTPALCVDEPILRETGIGNVFISSDLAVLDAESVLSTVRKLKNNASLHRNAQRFEWASFVAHLMSEPDGSDAP